MVLLHEKTFTIKISSKLSIFFLVLLPALQVCFHVQPALAVASIEELNDKPVSAQESAQNGQVKTIPDESQPADGEPEVFANNDVEDASVEKWSPYFHVTTKASEDRQLGRFNCMWPIVQSSGSMFFTDVRATVDNDNAIEANIGLGYRRIVWSNDSGHDWIWGVYGYYDRLKSSYGNLFNQGTFGAELLTRNIELRSNLYIPDSTSHVVGRNAVSSVSLSGTTVMGRTLSYEAYERSLPGFDFEVGYGFDIGKKDQLWLHGGYFYFDHSDTPEIAGPRLRLQYEWNDAFGWSRSTLAFGVEIQHDDVRQTPAFAGITWSIPIGSRRKSLKGSGRWRSIRSRMVRPIVRDVDVVTFSEDITKAPGTAGGPEIVSETEAPLVDPATDQQVDVYFVTANGGATGVGTQVDPMTVDQAEGASGASDVIFLLNDDGGIDVSGASGGTLTLKPHQQLLGVGDGTSTVVSLPQNQTLDISTATGRPTLTRPNGSSTVTMLWDNTLEGVALSGGTYGTYGLNVNNPTFSDVVIENSSNHGVYLVNSSGTVSISDSVIQNNVRDAAYLENTAGGTVSIDVTDSDILSNGNQGIQIQNSNGSSATVHIMQNQMVGNTDEGLLISNSVGSTLTAAVYDNLISGSGDDNLYVVNSASTLNLDLYRNDITNSTTDAGIHISSTLAGSVFSASFTHNIVTGNYDQGVLLYNSGDSFDLTVRDNTITSNQAGGIDFDTDSGATVLTIADNIISSNIGGAVNNDYGLQIDQDSGASNTLAMTLTNNLIENNGYTGIWLDNRDGTFMASVTGNSIANNGLSGIYIVNQTTGVLDAGLHNNAITGNAGTGIWLDNRAGTFTGSLTENSIANNGLNGIYMVNQTTGIFDAGLYNNAISGNVGTGVWLNNNTGTLNALFANNTIATNVGDGLELDNVNAGVFHFDLGGGSLASAGLNTILANGSGVDIDNDTGASIKAENNWWGVAPPNPARFSGPVDYDPWLTSDPN